MKVNIYKNYYIITAAVKHTRTKGGKFIYFLNILEHHSDAAQEELNSSDDEDQSTGGVENTNDPQLSARPRRGAETDTGQYSTNIQVVNFLLTSWCYKNAKLSPFFAGMRWLLEFSDPTPQNYTGLQQVKLLPLNCSEMDAFTAVFDSDFFHLLKNETNKYDNNNTSFCFTDTCAMSSLVTTEQYLLEHPVTPHQCHKHQPHLSVQPPQHRQYLLSHERKLLA
jgi:hypothetical protein